jgi:hypothetical protein
MTTTIIELRQRANALGFRLHHRRDEWQLIYRRRNVSGSKSLAGIAMLLDIKEGRRVVEYVGGCGIILRPLQ